MPPPKLLLKCFILETRACKIGVGPFVTKIPLTFHYTGCLIGIFLMVAYTHITGQYNSLYNTLRAFSLLNLVSFINISSTLQTNFPVLRNIRGWKTSLFASDLLNEFTLKPKQMFVNLLFWFASGGWNHKAYSPNWGVSWWVSSHGIDSVRKFTENFSQIQV